MPHGSNIFPLAGPLDLRPMAAAWKNFYSLGMSFYIGDCGTRIGAGLRAGTASARRPGVLAIEIGAAYESD
jgi:hypothetical protein